MYINIEIFLYKNQVAISLNFVKNRTYGVSISILAIVLFLFCRSSLTACMSLSFIGNSNNSSNKIPTNLTNLPSCHQLPTNKENPQAKSHTDTQENADQCKCALSYSDLLESKLTVKYIAIVIFVTIWDAVPTIGQASVSKNKTISSYKFDSFQYNITLDTIRLLI